MQFTEAAKPRRKPSLTPMIDVVFLLLVFFMLASRFGVDQVITMPLVSGGGDFSGRPKLVDVLPEEVRLNGITVSEDGLIAGLAELMEKPTESIIMRSTNGAKVQRLITTSETLRAAGYSSIVLVE